MIKIIIILVIIGVVYSIFEKLSDLVGGAKELIIMIAALLVVFFTFGWSGIVLMIGIAVVVAVLGIMIKEITDTVIKHDKNKKETAIIYNNTEMSREIHNNEMALRKELDLNCRYLGFMDRTMWAQKLPNYANKEYATDFYEITKNFAEQMEQQYILQNDDWFEPFLKYIMKHQQGKTVTQLINEVNSPHLRITHVTSDYELLKTRLIKGSERVSKDVPALFEKKFIGAVNEYLFTPTQYAKKIYGRKSSDNNEINHSEEISFDDL